MENMIPSVLPKTIVNCDVLKEIKGYITFVAIKRVLNLDSVWFTIL
jgi:hypothetical protein